MPPGTYKDQGQGEGEKALWGGNPWAVRGWEELTSWLGALQAEGPALRKVFFRQEWGCLMWDSYNLGGSPPHRHTLGMPPLPLSVVRDSAERSSLESHLWGFSEIRFQSLDLSLCWAVLAYHLSVWKYWAGRQLPRWTEGRPRGP